MMGHYIIGAGISLIILTVIVLLLSYTAVYEPKGKRGKRLLEKYPARNKKNGSYRGTTYLLILSGIGLVTIAVVFCYWLMVR